MHHCMPSLVLALSRSFLGDCADRQQENLARAVCSTGRAMFGGCEWEKERMRTQATKNNELAAALSALDDFDLVYLIRSRLDRADGALPLGEIDVLLASRFGIDPTRQSARNDLAGARAGSTRLVFSPPAVGIIGKDLVARLRRENENDLALYEHVRTNRGPEGKRI